MQTQNTISLAKWGEQFSKEQKEEAKRANNYYEVSKKFTETESINSLKSMESDFTNLTKFMD